MRISPTSTDLVNPVLCGTEISVIADVIYTDASQ